MDPLSVSASIIGVLGAAAKVSSVLADFVRRTKAAPKTAHSVLAQVNSLSIVLHALQAFLLGTATVSKSGASLVLIEQVLVVLTECVKVFSELEDVLGTASEEAEMGIQERIKWALKSDRITSIEARLETNKSSLTLMLTVLQCTSSLEAQNALTRLCELVEQVLKSNQVMNRRLRAMEDRGDQIRPLVEDDQLSLVTLEPEDMQHNQPKFAFEEDLLSSQVYRRPLFSRSGESLILSAARSTTASVLSALSVADVGDISGLAVPIYAHEISNSRRYTFGDFDPPTPSKMPSKSSQQPEPAKRNSMTLLFSRSKRKSKKSEGSLTPQPAVLGVPLEESIRYANVAICHGEFDEKSIWGYIPIWVAKTGVFLKEKATDVEDIFNVSGSPKRLRDLEIIFNTPDRYGKGLDWTGYTVHDAAALLLRCLYRLPESVIPPDFYEQFRQPFLDFSSMSDKGRIILKSDEKRVLAVYMKLVANLPPFSRQLLLYLLDLLAVFGSKQDINKMTSARLSAIFQPGILSPVKQGDDFIEEQHSRWLSQDVLTFLIERSDEFMKEAPGGSQR